MAAAMVAVNIRHEQTADSCISSAAAIATGTNLFVNYLPLDVSDEQLRQRFESYGTILSARIMRHLDDGHTEGRSKGYGFVLYAERESAIAAIEAEHAAQWGTKRLVVSIAARAFDGEDKKPAAKENNSAATDKPAAKPKSKPQKKHVDPITTTTAPLVSEEDACPMKPTVAAKPTRNMGSKPANRNSTMIKLQATPAPPATAVASSRSIVVSPVFGPMPPIVQALSMFGEVEKAAIDRVTGAINITFDTAAHALSAVRALHGNLVHTIHPNLPLQARLVPQGAPDAEQAAPSAAPRAHVVSLQATPATQVAPYMFQSVRVGPFSSLRTSSMPSNQTFDMRPSIRSAQDPRCVPSLHLPQPPNGSFGGTPSRVVSPIQPPPPTPVSNPLTAVFSKTVKEANKQLALRQQSSDALSFADDTAPRRATRTNAPYAPSPVQPQHQFAQLPFPAAQAGGYVDGYGTGASEFVVPSAPQTCGRPSRCHYCQDTATVLVHNCPVDEYECQRMLDEQFGAFGNVRFIECWGGGDAVVAFFDLEAANAAVDALCESEFAVSYWDCSGTHR